MGRTLGRAWGDRGEMGRTMGRRQFTLWQWGEKKMREVEIFC